MKIRALKENEIEIRVGQVSEKGFSLLLYKEARADMDILDETFGALGWTREHLQIGNNIFCKVSGWNKEIGQWVYKMDVGSESRTEAIKGQSSDSFKRACVNWGIGRELYTSPFIWIQGGNYLTEKNGKKNVFEKFRVKEIESQNGQITKLKIIDSKNKEIFNFGENKQNETQNKSSQDIDFEKIRKDYETTLDTKDKIEFANMRKILFENSKDLKIKEKVKDYYNLLAKKNTFKGFKNVAKG